MGFSAELPSGLLPLDDVEGMRRFLEGLIIPKLHNYVYIQWYFGAAVTALVGLFAIVIVGHRLFTRSVWLFQLYSTPRGIFIIPNAVITFAIFIFVYAFLYVAYVFVNVKFHETGIYAKAYMLLRGAPWMTIWVGCWFSTAGTMSAFPDALSIRGRHIGLIQRTLFRPVAFNTALFMVPVLSTGTVYIPMIMSIHVFNKMLDRHRVWLERTTDPMADVATLAMEAREIWKELTRAYFYDSITYALYTAWDVFLLLVFFCIASHTLLRVRAQVKLAQRKKEALAETQPTFYLFSSRPNYGQSLDNHVTATPSLPPAAAKRSPQVIEVEQTATTSVLFPALKVQPGEKLSRAEAVARRSKALRLVYRSLLIQYVAIGLGIISFILMAALVAITSYYAARTNRLQDFVEPHYVINCWINICYGCTIVAAVAWRSFDKAFILGGGEEVVEEVELEVSEPTTDRSGDASKHSDGHLNPTSVSPCWSADVDNQPRSAEIKLTSSRDRLLSQGISVLHDEIDMPPSCEQSPPCKDTTGRSQATCQP